MRFLSTPTKFPFISNNPRRERRFSKLLPAVGVLFGIIAAGVAFFAGAAWAVPAIADDDALALLSQNLGGWNLADIAWANMNPSEKQSIRDQAAQIALMAEAARRDAVDDDVRVSKTLQWGTNAVLAEEWKKRIVASTDLSPGAVGAFYEANSARYQDEGAVRYRKATWPLKQKNTAARVKKQLRTAHLDQYKNSVPVGWTGFDKIDAMLVRALREAPLNKVMGPLQTSEGALLFEVLERRGKGKIPLEQCSDRVKEDMIQTAIKSRLP